MKWFPYFLIINLNTVLFNFKLYLTQLLFMLFHLVSYKIFLFIIYKYHLFQKRVFIIFEIFQFKLIIFIFYIDLKMFQKLIFLF
jgi:hypothetical protein